MRCLAKRGLLQEVTTPLEDRGWTVWYAGQLLGTTNLKPASFSPLARIGVLAPIDAFADIWTEIGPVLREPIDVAQALRNDPQSLAGMRPDPSESKDEFERRVRQALLAHPLTKRLIDAHARATALAFEVRDANGQAIRCSHVVVQELRPPDFIPPDMFEQEIAEAAESGIEMGRYVVLVIAPLDHGRNLNPSFDV